MTKKVLRCRAERCLSTTEEKTTRQTATNSESNAKATLSSQPNEKGETEKPPEEPVKKTTATISGNVSKEWGGPLGGALVKVGETEGHSDVDGKFSLSIPMSEPKTMTLSLSCLGFENQSKEIELSPDGHLTLDFTMGKGKSALEGVVSDAETGQPLAGAYVSIESQVMYTSQDGRFTFNEIEANRRYPLTAYSDGYETKSVLVDWIEPGEPLTYQMKLPKKKPEVEKSEADTERVNQTPRRIPIRFRADD